VKIAFKTVIESSQERKYQRTIKKIPNIIELKYRIKNYYSLEQYIAIKNNNLKGFEKYWTYVTIAFFLS
jgi:hypothetical protein